MLKTLGGLTNDELAATFAEWNQGELKSFLVEITAIILAKKDDKVPGDYLVDKIQDKTGAKGTGGQRQWASTRKRVELLCPMLHDDDDDV